MSGMLTINTLGKFSLSVDGKMISDYSVRSQKVWRIFKYLITNRHKVVTTEALMEILWPEQGPKDPLKLLYTHMSRLRHMLQTGEASENYILYRQNGYQWNSEVKIDLDAANFENLLASAHDASTDEEKCFFLKAAVALYAGDYLSESASETWALPVTNYYKRLYLRAVNELADIYARGSEFEEIIMLCNGATEKEPYDESLHERLIQALLLNNETARAKKQYRHIEELMQREFGARPSDGLQALYAEMSGNDGDKPYDLTAIKLSLEREDTRRGAYFCTSDMFRQIYQIDMRSEERIQFPVILGVITVLDADGGLLEEKVHKNAMRSLRQCLTNTLRRGDVISQYTKYQFLLLLSAYLPKDAEKAMERVKRVFESGCRDKKIELDITLSQLGNKKLAQVE